MTAPLTPTELQGFRETLSERYTELAGEIENLELEAIETPGGAPVEEQGDEAAEADKRTDLELLEHRGRTLQDVTRALERLDEGRFGRCERCGAWIERERLSVLPEARRCAPCELTVAAAG
jgi:DnaK suppressor protein